MCFWNKNAPGGQTGYFTCKDKSQSEQEDRGSIPRLATWIFRDWCWELASFTVSIEIMIEYTWLIWSVCLLRFKSYGQGSIPGGDKKRLALPQF